MSPLDGELRRALSDRAVRVEPAADPLAGIERRARSMRRNRLASVAAAVALLVSGAAVAVPAVIDSTGTDARPEPILTTSPEPTPTAAPDQLPLIGESGRLDPASPWAYRGVDLTIRRMVEFRDAWRERYPDASFTPLFGKVWEPSGQLEVVFLSTGTEQGDLWGVVQATESGPDFPWVRPLLTPTTALAAALPGDEGVARLLLVTAPGIPGQTYFPRSGDEGLPLAPLAPGVGTLGMSGDAATDIVEVRLATADPLPSAAGELVYRDLAPDLPSQSAEPSVNPTGAPVTEAPASRPPSPQVTASPTVTPTAASAPANAVTWPLRGSLSVAPDLDAAREAFALGLGGDVEDLTFRPLLATDFDGGLRLVAGQAWLAGGRAHAVSYAVGGGCPATPFIGAPISAGAGVLAYALGCVPGRTTDTVMVVPQPQTGQVSYATAGSPYRDLDFLPGLEPVVEFDRDDARSRGVDRIRVLDGNGDLDDPVYDGPLDALLCGIKECG